MKQLVFVVVSLFLLLPTADALECIAIKTAAINPATRECSYFETVCSVPSGWRTVSYCPEDDIQFFRLSKYLPGIGLLFGSFIGFFILVMMLRKFLFSLDTKSDDSVYREPREPLWNRIAHFFQNIHLPHWSIGAFFQGILLKWKMKHAFSQNDPRSVYRQDIQSVSQAVHSRTASEVSQKPNEKKDISLASPVQKQAELTKAMEGTNWDEFKKTLKKLETLDKKKEEKQ